MCYRITPHLEETKKYNDKSEKNLKLVPMRSNNYWCGTEGYLITKRGARFLLKAIEKVGLKVPVDTMMMWATRNFFGPFNDFGVVPRMGRSFTATETNNVDSDIQGDMEKVRYNLEIIILKPKLFEANHMLLDFIKENYPYIELLEISDNIKPNQLILSKVNQPLPIKNKTPIIYVVDDLNEIEVLTDQNEMDNHYICKNTKISDQIKTFRKSTYENLTKISDIIDTYYFNYWKKNYPNI
jgi:GR25 family glycosyltransferase involved in LPS biosynthesis